jgi:hypothetical protein
MHLTGYFAVDENTLVSILGRHIPSGQRTLIYYRTLLGIQPFALDFEPTLIFLAPIGLLFVVKLGPKCPSAALRTAPFASIEAAVHDLIAVHVAMESPFVAAEHLLEERKKPTHLALLSSHSRFQAARNVSLSTTRIKKPSTA